MGGGWRKSSPAFDPVYVWGSTGRSRRCCCEHLSTPTPYSVGSPGEALFPRLLRRAFRLPLDGGVAEGGARRALFIPDGSWPGFLGVASHSRHDLPDGAGFP